MCVAICAEATGGLGTTMHADSCVLIFQFQYSTAATISSFSPVTLFYSFPDDCCRVHPPIAFRKLLSGMTTRLPHVKQPSITAGEVIPSAVIWSNDLVALCCSLSIFVKSCIKCGSHKIEENELRCIIWFSVEALISTKGMINRKTYVV